MDRLTDTDLRSRWDEVVEAVSRGETVGITREGRPFAVIAPASTLADQEPWDANAALERMRQARRGNKLNGVTLKELIDEGRRF